MHWLNLHDFCSDLSKSKLCQQTWLPSCDYKWPTCMHNEITWCKQNHVHQHQWLIAHWINIITNLHISIIVVSIYYYSCLFVFVLQILVNTRLTICSCLGQCLSSSSLSLYVADRSHLHVRSTNPCYCSMFLMCFMYCLNRLFIVHVCLNQDRCKMCTVRTGKNDRVSGVTWWPTTLVTQSLCLAHPQAFPVTTHQIVKQLLVRGA